MPNSNRPCETVSCLFFIEQGFGPKAKANCGKYLSLFVENGGAELLAEESCPSRVFHQLSDQVRSSAELTPVVSQFVERVHLTDLSQIEGGDDAA